MEENNSSVKNVYSPTYSPLANLLSSYSFWFYDMIERGGEVWEGGGLRSSIKKGFVVYFVNQAII